METPLQAAKTSTKAAFALVLSIFGLFCLGILIGPVAIYLAVSARRDIRRSDGRLKGNGLAITGIVIGACATILWLLISVELIGLPFYLKANTPLAIAEVKGTMDSVAKAIEAYHRDHKAYPDSLGQLTTPMPYVSSLPLDICSIHDGKMTSTFDYRRYKGQWILRSRGMNFKPDANIDDFASWTDQPSEWVSRWTYDPSNGIFSSGDILRIGP